MGGSVFKHRYAYIVVRLLAVDVELLIVSMAFNARALGEEVGGRTFLMFIWGGPTTGVDICTPPRETRVDSRRGNFMLSLHDEPALSLREVVEAVEPVTPAEGALKISSLKGNFPAMAGSQSQLIIGHLHVSVDSNRLIETPPLETNLLT